MASDTPAIVGALDIFYGDTCSYGVEFRRCAVHARSFLCKRDVWDEVTHCANADLLRYRGGDRFSRVKHLVHEFK
jgi:hypothetical protein